MAKSTYLVFNRLNARVIVRRQNLQTLKQINGLFVDALIFSRIELIHIRAGMIHRLGGDNGDAIDRLELLWDQRSGLQQIGGSNPAFRAKRDFGRR